MVTNTVGVLEYKITRLGNVAKIVCRPEVTCLLWVGFHRSELTPRQKCVSEAWCHVRLLWIITDHSSRSLPGGAVGVCSGLIAGPLGSGGSEGGGVTTLLSPNFPDTCTRTSCESEALLPSLNVEPGSCVLMWLPWTITSLLTLSGTRREVLN